MVTYEVDVKPFVKALEDYAAKSSRTIAEVVNAACLDVIIKTAQSTPTASSQRIGEEMRKKVWVTSRDRDKRGRERSRPRLVPQAIAIVASRDMKKGRTMSKEQVRAAARKMTAARKSSAGYIAFAGWQKAALAFGGRGFGSRKSGDLNPKSKAARGHGTPATVGRLVAEFSNTATASERIGLQALQAVLNWKTQDLRRRLQDKLNAAAKR